MTERSDDADETAKVATITLIVVTVVADLFLACVGISDRGWLKLAIELFVVPLVNIVIFAVAIGRAGSVTRGSNGWGIAYSVAAFFLPAGAAAVTIWGMWQFSYHGS